MRRCSACDVDVRGGWHRCPLCASPLTGPVGPDPLPAIPLRFSRRRLFRILFWTSLVLIAASFGLQLVFARRLAGLGGLRSVWLGVATMWLVVLMAVRKRRNVAKGTLYLVVLVDLVCAYWDFLTGWRAWSVTFAVPIVNVCAVVALLITVRAMRTEVGDHILYSVATVVLGLTPLAFVGLGWVTTPVPSAVGGGVSLLALAVIQGDRVSEVRHELGRRLNL